MELLSYFKDLIIAKSSEYILIDNDEQYSWEDCEAVPVRSITDEPVSYKMTNAHLLGMDDEDWNDIWKQHNDFHDTMLKKIQFGHSRRIVNQIIVEMEDYTERMHLRMRSIMLERRLRRLEYLANDLL